MKKKPKRYPALYVEWVDSHADPRRVWKPVDELPVTPGKCVTVGFLARETADVLVIAGSHHPDGNAFAGEMAIPKRAITKRKLVRFA